MFVFELFCSLLIICVCLVILVCWLLFILRWVWLFVVGLFVVIYLVLWWLFVLICAVVVLLALFVIAYENCFAFAVWLDFIWYLVCFPLLSGFGCLLCAASIGVLVVGSLF